jgi:hypothetical protein
MNLLSQITLKWYDDSSLMAEDRRELVELFLDSAGITREIAADIFELLLIARSKGLSLTSREIRDGIAEMRERRGKSPDDSLTLRNIQIWLKYFRNLGLLEKIGGRYFFKGNKKPSAVFREYVKPEVIDKSADYLARVLEKLEDRYGIKK